MVKIGGCVLVNIVSIYVTEGGRNMGLGLVLR